MTSTVETLGALHLAVERKHSRSSVIQHFDGDRLISTPDWRFHRQIVRYALYLQERAGLTAGGHVLLLAPVSPAWLVVDWATVAQGGVSVVLAPDSSIERLAAAWDRFAPVSVLVAGPDALANVLALETSGRTPHDVVTLDAQPTKGTVSFEQVLELGGTLDTAERAGAFRDRARSIGPTSHAIVHEHPSSNGSPLWEILTHAEVLARGRRDQARASRPGGIAYVRPDALSVEAHVALYRFLGDGITSTVVGASTGDERHQIARLDPRNVVGRTGVVQRPAPRTSTGGRARELLDRIFRTVVSGGST
jgi:acyl-CoA synthetase (AMP-forming)/AMP-acid ligase II